jgi:hypothetical protein
MRNEVIPALVQQGIYDLNFHWITLLAILEGSLAVHGSKSTFWIPSSYFGQKIAISVVRFDSW